TTNSTSTLSTTLFFFFQAEDGIRDFSRDWSSDVCSSDLAVLEEQMAAHLATQRRAGFAHLGLDQRMPGLPHQRQTAVRLDPRRRSEERRVGKECRARRAGCRSNVKQVDVVGEVEGLCR